MDPPFSSKSEIHAMSSKLPTMSWQLKILVSKTITGASSGASSGLDIFGNEDTCLNVRAYCPDYVIVFRYLKDGSTRD